jgi:hypothetical protein
MQDLTPDPQLPERLRVTGAGTRPQNGVFGSHRSFMSDRGGRVPKTISREKGADPRVAAHLHLRIIAFSWRGRSGGGGDQTVPEREPGVLATRLASVPAQQMKESPEPAGTVSHTARLDPGGGCLETDTVPVRIARIRSAILGRGGLR